MYAKGPEYDTLIKMGNNILPMVVAKLKDPKNLFGCQLYNKLQTDPKKKSRSQGPSAIL